MKCNKCKFWVVLNKKESDVWLPVLSDDGLRLGWCRKRCPIKTQTDSKNYQKRAEWPETKEVDYCGDFEPETTELEWLRAENSRYYDKWITEKLELRKLKRKHNTLIKAVKTKYPKIKINYEALERAVDIIQKHEPT